MIWNKSSDNVKWCNIFHYIWPVLHGTAISFDPNITEKYENYLKSSGNEKSWTMKKKNNQKTFNTKSNLENILVTDRLPTDSARERERWAVKTDKIEQNIAYEFKSHSIMLYIIKFHAVNIHSSSLFLSPPPPLSPSLSLSFSLLLTHAHFLLSILYSPKILSILFYLVCPLKLPLLPIVNSMPMVLSWRLIHTTYHQVHYQFYKEKTPHTTHIQSMPESIQIKHCAMNSYPKN